MNKKIDNNDIQYKIVKSEACGHTIEYKMVKSINLKKDEDSPRKSSDKLQNQLVQHAREGKKTGVKLLDNMIADAKDEKRMITPAERGELAHNLRIKKEKQDKEKKQQKLAASEEECKCEDKAEKCECEDKEMKKREKFYIQKIQELRKQQSSLPGFETPKENLMNNISKYRGQASDAFSGLKNKAIDAARGANTQISLPGMETGREKLMSTMRNIPGKVVDTVSKAPAAVRTGTSALGNLASKTLPYAGKAAGIASALIPSQIGAGQNDPEQQFINEQHARSRAAKVSPEATQNVANLLSNKQPATQAEPMMSMANQNMSVQGQAPAQSTPQAPQSFGEAFKAARADREKQIAAGTYNPKLHDTFKYTDPKSGKEASFHSFTKDDFAQGVGNKYNPELRRQQKAIQSSPATPNTETAPSANPIKPADQGSTKLRPEPLSLEQQQKQFS